jgi:hypothetical protein
MQRRYADEQIFKRKLDAFRLFLALNSAGNPRDFERHWVDGHIACQPLDEIQPPVSLLLRLGAIGSMHQFGDGHDRNAYLDLALDRVHLFQDLPDSPSSTFGGNDDAGVED